MRRLLKSHRWWSYKVPPLLAVAYYAIGGSPTLPRVTTTLWQLSLFVVAVVGIAGFGHVITDAFDVAEDRATRRENAWDRLGWTQRVGLVAALLAASWLPWLLLPAGTGVLALLVLEFALFAAYAVPPLRLKARGLGGVIADALYAHAVPALVTWLTFSRAATTPTPPWLGVLLGTWAVAVGMRHLLYHQAQDADRDRQVGVATFAARRGRTATLLLITDRLMPVEIVAFLALVAVFALHAPAVAVGFAGYVAWETYKLRALWLQPIDLFGSIDLYDRAGIVGVRMLTRFYERWLPLLMLAGLIARSPEYLVLLALHLTLFRNALGDLVWQDFPLALAHRRRAR